jgi:hypothetical protein
MTNLAQGSRVSATAGLVRGAEQAGESSFPNFFKHCLNSYGYETNRFGRHAKLTLASNNGGKDSNSEKTMFERTTDLYQSAGAAAENLSNQIFDHVKQLAHCHQ